MFDLHCHILPGIDDGPKELEDSLQLARLAVQEGITHVVATPHHKNGLWDNEKEEILEHVEKLQQQLDAEKIPLTIFPGQEVRIHGELLENIDANTIQFIDEQEQYLLIEFPTKSVPAYTDRLFYELMQKGVVPIIVHPERNRIFYKEPDRLKSLVEKGALAQLTAGSYTGAFGQTIQTFSRQLIEADLVHFMASDAHDATKRPFLMKDAYEQLTTEFGQGKVDHFQQITQDILNGVWVVPSSPTHIQKQKLFSFRTFRKKRKK